MIQIAIYPFYNLLFIKKNVTKYRSVINERRKINSKSVEGTVGEKHDGSKYKHGNQSDQKT